MSTNEPLVPGAKSQLDKLKIDVANETLGKDVQEKVTSENYQALLDEKKWEVASELNLKEKIEHDGWGNMTTKEVGKIGGSVGGKIGGNMVKKLIQQAEAEMGSDQAPPTKP